MREQIAKLALVALLSIGVTEAANAKGGFYAGAGLGTQIRRDRFNVTNTFDDVTSKVNDHTQTFVGDILLGYGFNLDGYHVGGEIDFAFGPTNSTNVSLANGASVVSQRATNALSGRVLLGKYVGNDNLVYAGLGVEGRRFKTNLDVRLGDNVGDKSTKVGFQWALGFQTPITDDIGVRGEFRESYFGSSTNQNGDSLLKSSRRRADTFLVSVVFNLSGLMG